MYSIVDIVDNISKPWLVWLSPGLSAGLEPKGHQFNSQSGHMPGVADQVSSWGRAKGNHTSMFLSLSFSLPSLLSKNNT